MQLVQLQRAAEKFKAARVQVVGISYDNAKVLKGFAEKKSIKFPLVTDPDSKVMEKYLVRNKSARAGSRLDGIAYAVTVVIGKDGKVKERLYKGYRQRPKPEDILAAATKQKKQADSK